MCGQCEVMRKQMWNEVRDLLNFNRPIKGPLSEDLEMQFEKAVEREVMTEEEAALAIEALRAELIALRCAFIVRAIPGGEFHNVPPSLIMGSWAGQTMQSERLARMEKLFGNLFGSMREEQSDE
jgi:hypothetical protein